MKLLARIIAIFFGLLLTVAIVLGSLISTSSGSRWLIEQALIASDQNLTLSGVEGSLIGTLRVASLVYRPDANDGVIKLENLSILWNPLALIYPRIDIPSLSLDRLTIDIAQSEKPFSLPEISLPVDIRVDQLNITEVEITRPDNPVSIKNLQASGQFYDNSLKLSRLSLSTSAAEFDANGTLTFTNDFPIDIDMSLGDIHNQSKLRIQADGLLDDYRFSGSVTHVLSGQPELNATFTGRGTLSGLALESFRSADLGGKLSGSGSLHWSDSIQAKFNLDGTDINTGLLSKNLTGRVDINSKVSWQNQSLDIQIEARGQIREQPLTMQLELTGNEQLARIRTGRLELGPNKFILSGEIPMQDNGSLELSLHGENNTLLKTHIETRPESGRWLLLISDSLIKSPYWPTLTQGVPATAMLEMAGADTSLSLSNLCLHGSIESACLDGKATSENLFLLLTLDDVPVKRFKSWITVSEEARERLSGSVRLDRSTKQWALKSTLEIDEKNRTQIEASLAHASGLLNGRIQADSNKLGWLSLLSEQLSHTRGQISAKLDLGGSIEKPEISGPIILDNASLNLPETGSSLSDIRLTALLKKDQKIDIQGEVTSGEGTLELSGEASWWPKNERMIRIDIQGTNFTLANLPDVYAVVSPELILAIDTKRVLLTGSMTLPILAITLENIPEQAVTISPDARIVGQENDPVEKTSTLPVYADIEVLLGKDVQFSGKGLDAVLGGALTLKDSADKPLHANGKIEIKKGSYTAYGQNLSLKNSSFIFNGPLSQPGLDLQAQRKIKDITVGLRVRGSLQSPETEIFSKTGMSDSDAIAYLLTGRPLSAANSEDGNLMLSTLAQLGVKGSAGLVENIRSATGLSTLEINSGDELSDTALKIGKYLSPKLYIQYATRLFTDSTSIKARYDINDKLYIETESGSDSSVDLKFRVEH